MYRERKGQGAHVSIQQGGSLEAAGQERAEEHARDACTGITFGPGGLTVHTVQTQKCVD